MSYYNKTIWYSADTHFNHPNILKYVLERSKFKDIDEMNQELITKWNQKVKKEDIVFHLGDFAFGSVSKSIEIKEQLNGHIVHIMGNHDWSSRKGYLLYKEKYNKLNMFIGEFTVALHHKPIDFDKSTNPDLKEIDYCICGHVHEKWLWSGKNYNVGVDVHDFAPVSYDSVLDDLRRRKRSRQTEIDHFSWVC